MIQDDDGYWYPENADDLIQKTDQDVILQREQARKRALELLAGTSIEERLTKKVKPKNI